MRYLLPAIAMLVVACGPAFDDASKTDPVDAAEETAPERPKLAVPHLSPDPYPPGSWWGACGDGMCDGGACVTRRAEDFAAFWQWEIEEQLNGPVDLESYDGDLRCSFECTPETETVCASLGGTCDYVIDFGPRVVTMCAP